jgi:tRNA-dihydrouridine synthase A
VNFFLPSDRFSAAPMVDVTTSAFRRAARLFTKKATLYTEMVAAQAIVHGAMRLLEFSPEEMPLVLQLGGSDPAVLARAAREGEKAGFAAVNLNAGCPSDKVQSGDFGAVMMKDPGHLADCVKAMQDAVSVPVTVKTRIGVDALDSEDFTRTLIGAIYGTGCRHVIIHARKAWLNGLSPKENRTVPPLDYDRVYRLKEAFPDLAITINGGITTIDQCLDQLGRVDGVMLGRALIDNPYLMAQVDSRIFGDGAPVKSREEILEAAMELASKFKAEGRPFRHLGQHFLNLFASCPGSRRYRRYLSAHLGDEDGAAVLGQAYAQMKQGALPGFGGDCVEENDGALD